VDDPQGDYHDYWKWCGDSQEAKELAQRRGIEMIRPIPEYSSLWRDSQRKVQKLAA